MMRWLRVAYRVALMLPLFLYGVILSLIFLAGRDPRRAYLRHRWVIRHWLALATGLVGVRPRVSGQPQDGPVLMVSNHISWLDILVLGGLLPPRFLSKAEVRDWPLVGWLSACAGTLYIRRGSRGGADSAGEAITHALRHGARVLIFPEGTTTNGLSVKRFHPRLFQTAIEVGAPVQAVALHYTHESGINPKVPWIDDAGFFQSLLDILGEREVPVEVHFGTVHAAGAITDRRHLADLTEREIREFVEDRSGVGGDRGQATATG
jgi:1-acyl-sn-glycerol-3-phosphate acyltransferase